MSKFVKLHRVEDGGEVFVNQDMVVDMYPTICNGKECTRIMFCQTIMTLEEDMYYKPLSPNWVDVIENVKLDKNGFYICNDNSSNDPYWSRITEMAQKQRNKGLEEYGKGIEEDTADVLTRLTRIQEELIDSLYYIEHLKDYHSGK